LRGIRLVDQCHFDEALPWFERALRASPHNKFTMIKYGEALTKAFWLDEAIAVFEQADKLPTTSPNVLLYGSWAKALALASGDGLSAAEAKLRHADRQADKAGGRDARIHRVWGDILRDHKQYGRATDEYRVAIALDPQDATAYEKWGLVLFESGDVAGAIEKLRLAIARNGNAAEARYRLGWALLRQEDIAGAVGAFRDAAAVAAPGQAKPWSEMADSLAGEPRERSAALLQAVEKLAPTGCPSIRIHQPVPMPKAAAVASAPMIR
jgi:tetratricopeptide (TPR) repeat protein